MLLTNASALAACFAVPTLRAMFPSDPHRYTLCLSTGTDALADPRAAGTEGVAQGDTAALDLVDQANALLESAPPAAGNVVVSAPARASSASSPSATLADSLPELGLGLITMDNDLSTRVARGTTSWRSGDSEAQVYSAAAVKARVGELLSLKGERWRVRFRGLKRLELRYMPNKASTLRVQFDGRDRSGDAGKSPHAEGPKVKLVYRLVF